MPCETAAVSVHILSTPYNYAPVYGVTSFETFWSWVQWAIPAILPSGHHQCSILARSSQFLPLTCNAGRLGFSQGTLAFPPPPPLRQTPYSLVLEKNKNKNSDRLPRIFSWYSVLPPPPSSSSKATVDSPVLSPPKILVHITSEGWLSAGRKHFCQAM